MSEPHKMSPVPLPEQPGRTPVPNRSKAWREYRDIVCANWIPRDENTAKAAFIAGWEACGGAVNQVRGEPVDLRCEMCKSDD